MWELLGLIGVALISLGLLGIVITLAGMNGR